jgi:gliding motility-associated-like protein
MQSLAIKLLLLPVISTFILLLFSCSKNNSHKLTNCDNLVNDSRDATDSFYIVIPNAFTPNGDGLNDWYGPVTKNISSIMFTITDQNNNSLFTTNNLNEKWKPSNSTITQGKYYYRIQGISTNNKKIGLCGEVNLLYCFPKNVNENSFYFESQLRQSGPVPFYDTSVPFYEAIPVCN